MTKMTKQQLIDENIELRAALDKLRAELDATKRLVELAQTTASAQAVALERKEGQAAEALTLGQRAAAMAKKLGCTVFVDTREGMFYTKRSGVRHDLAAI